MFWTKRIYLDYAATTPVDKRVVKVMKPYIGGIFGNPASLYKEGVQALKAANEARKSVAGVLQCKSDEIIFTSGGTESNNLAILGTYFYHQNVLKNDVEDRLLHFVTTTIEHSSVLEIFRHIEDLGGKVTYVAPKENGIVSVKDIEDAIYANTVLVSVMYANNEIGTIQPIREIGKVIKKKKEEGQNIIFHVDACQGALFLSLFVHDLFVDLLTLDGSKMYGPKGTGVLYKKRGVCLSPIIFGGGQEQGLRSGTENVAGIVGFATALNIARAEREREAERLTALRNYLFSELTKRTKEIAPDPIILNGDEVLRLPNNINICKLGLDAEYAVMRLDVLGFAVSSVSTCKTLSDNPSSYVVEEIYKNKEDQGSRSCSQSSLRVTLGRWTTKRDIDRFIPTLLTVLDKKIV